MALELGWPAAQERFRAMGTDCHIMVVGPQNTDLAHRSMQRAVQLEHRWSRFLPDSEISTLNRSEGQPLEVSEDTINLVERAVLASRLTDGRFDPTMQRRMVELGYDRPFDQVGPSERPLPRPSQAAGCDGIEIDRPNQTVCFPAGMGFDPGGIGKGYAADLAATEAMAAGAWGVMVNLGGDLRVLGTPPRGDTWTVTIAEPAVASSALATVRLNDAGLATSTTSRRRWNSPDGVRHHLLQSTTGLPSTAAARLVSVVAGEAWWAEAAATALASSLLITARHPLSWRRRQRRQCRPTAALPTRSTTTPSCWT